VLVSLAIHGDEIQVNVLEARNIASVVGCRWPASDYGIQAGQFFAALGQMTASDILEQGQQTQANREQARQPVAWRSSSSTSGSNSGACPSSDQTVLHKYSAGKRERHLAARVGFGTVGAIYPPAEAGGWFCGLRFRPVER